MNASSAMWYPNIKQLSANFQVFAIDLLVEPGKSAPNVEIEDTQMLMQWYKAIFDTLKIERFGLIGASKGGWLATKLAMYQPQQVEKLILLSPAQTFIWIPPDRALLSNLIYEMAPNRRRLEKLFSQMSTHPKQIAPAFVELFHQATRISSLDKMLMEMQPFSKDELKQMDMPVLVLIGDNDIINNARSLDRANEYLPNVQTHMIKDAGHFLSLDRAEHVSKIILRFLACN
ncbi:MAG: alpha/beta fold hydrolase, partial [Bacteroidales bacterium]